jgi:hypothetical protein
MVRTLEDNRVCKAWEKQKEAIQFTNIDGFL